MSVRRKDDELIVLFRLRQGPQYVHTDILKSRIQEKQFQLPFFFVLRASLGTGVAVAYRGIDVVFQLMSVQLLSY